MAMAERSEKLPAKSKRPLDDSSGLFFKGE
jgi:hypothetical protein